MTSLNTAQQQAVEAPPGNLLILAGAGSGKTRVLVHRIAWMVQEWGISPYHILAVTFTNKAATEMRERLETALGQRLRGMWAGTFHGLAHKLLRLHTAEAQLPTQFQVLDSDDQLQILRRIFKSLNVNEERFEPRKVQGFINRHKDEGSRASMIGATNPHDVVMKQIYAAYETHCQTNGLVDFAELLLRSFELLKNNESLRQEYNDRFKHILVDEFQDTNTIQYQWLRLLGATADSVTVVGDDDQSIYGWRGAKVENIHRFEKDYKTVQLVRLEQNYRSTHTILAAANALIGNNGGRLGKTLWTEGAEGEGIRLYAGFNEEDEALYVVRQIKAWFDQGGAAREVAILYRSNAQSRVLEEAMVRAGIPYVIYGGLRFFERAEIKDALAYLRLACNCHDNAAFERIINTPPRGMGDKSIEKVRLIAASQNVSLWDALSICVSANQLSGKARLGSMHFIEIIQDLFQKAETSLSQLMRQVIEASGLLTHFREQKGEQAQNRAENLEELVNATADFEAEQQDELLATNAEHLLSTQDTRNIISTFLSHTALESGERQGFDAQKAIQMMTLHSAKGLEFPMVFICGLEEGLFPHHFSRESPQALEEERRLCYVGITRAMQKLHLTYAEKRRLFGRDERRSQSRFIKEIPSHLVETHSRRVSVTRAVPTLRAQNNVPDANGFFLGQRVSHPKFGLGIVVDSEGQGDRSRIHVHFELYGSKWLALSFAKLEPA